VQLARFFEGGRPGDAISPGIGSDVPDFAVTLDRLAAMGSLFSFAPDAFDADPKDSMNSRKEILR